MSIETAINELNELRIERKQLEEKVNAKTQTAGLKRFVEEVEASGLLDIERKIDEKREQLKNFIKSLLPTDSVEAAGPALVALQSGRRGLWD